MWRLVDLRIDAAHLPKIRGARTVAGLLPAGNARSNTAADYITVLEQALASLPADWRPDPDTDGGPAVVMRCDSAGATHRFATACRDRWVGFSFGFPVEARVWDAVDALNLADGWYQAIDSSGDIRDGAWVAEATTPVNLSTWPARTRLVLRKERPHPGAQLSFTDIDGMRVTAFITDTPPGSVPRAAGRPGTAPPPTRPRRGPHPPGQSRRPGRPALPCHSFDANAAWLEIVLAAADLVAWTKLIALTDSPQLARCEINTFRYRAPAHRRPHHPQRPQLRLHIGTTWRWAGGHRDRMAASQSSLPLTTRPPLIRTDPNARPPRDTG
jgi:hypothetical protein